jgi:hypothetical protein
MNDHDPLSPGVARLLGFADTPASLRLSDLRLRAASMLDGYGKHLQMLLRANQVRIPPALNLQTRPDGHIMVVGDHPDAAKVIGLFEFDISLVKGFKEVEVLHEIVRQAEAQASGEMHSSLPHFNLGVTSAGALVFFTR